MRLFLAVELEEAVRRAAARVAGDLARVLEPDGRRRVTWVRGPNLHLTLRFIGEVDAGVGAVLVERFARPLLTPAFTLSLEGVGAFPTHGPPRVIWAGVRQGDRALGALHDEAEERLTGLGLETEDRPFRAHLTLGRVKEALGGRAREALMRVGPIGSCRVEELTLFESRLSPAGPSYTVLARAPLAGRDEGSR